MAKKIFTLFILMVLVAGSTGYAMDDGRTDKNVFGRIMTLEGRGLMNIVGAPMEIFSTWISEVRKNKWAAPVTYAPNLINHIFIRATSGVYDMAITPWIAPFTNDISPLTEPMGLTRYPWQVAEEKF